MMCYRCILYMCYKNGRGGDMETWKEEVTMVSEGQ